MFLSGSSKEDPNHAEGGDSTILDIKESLDRQNPRLIQQGYPTLTFRAGISTGDMVVGDAGDVHHGTSRSDYTVLGDCVNLGARLETANKIMGTFNLLSARTVELAGYKFLFRPIDKL